MSSRPPEKTETAAAKNVSASKADWQREHCRRFEWNPGRQLLRSVRMYQRWRARRGLMAELVRRRAVVRHRFWSVVTAADIPLNSSIEGGLLLPHPNGVVIHPKAQIGPNCLLMQQVTIGTGGPLPGVPRLGGHVDVGCGARILGGVYVADHAKVGAIAVVLCDVPARATAVGVPARIIPAAAAAPDGRTSSDAVSERAASI